MPNKLPLNWCECKFEDVLDYEQPTRYIVSNTDYQEQGIAVLTAGKSFILGYTDEKDGIFDASKETVIIFDDFTTASKLVDFPFKVKSSAMKILHAKKDININFLYYLMQTIHYESDTHKRYWISEYAKQTLNLPPLAEQERIVEKIEALFAGIDEGVERLKSAQAQIKQYRQSVLKSAFEGKLYKTTEWKKSTLEQHIQEINYGTSEKTKDFGKIPVFRMGDIQEGKLTFNNFKYLNKINDEKLILKKGDLLFNRTNSAELVGKSAVFNHEGSYSFASYIIKVRFDTSLDSNFICYYINSPKGRNWAKTQISQQVGQANINGTKLKNLPFPLPTLPEQQRIVEEIEKRFLVADELEKAVNEGLEKADKLKQSILKKAFEGKLAPQNPNDEPASVLLERIKKSQTPTKGKKK